MSDHGELDPYAAFRSRDFRLLLTGNFLSSFGLQMLSVAVSWDLYLQTKSAVVLGNVGLVQVAPFLLFALASGHVADIYDRRRILVVTQAVFLLASALLAAGTRSVALIYFCLFLTATARTFQGPARLALLPHVAPEGALRNAITWNSSASEIANVSGPALAGIVLAVAGSASVYYVQCACGLAVLGCFGLLHSRAGVVKARTAAPQGLSSVLDGVRFVFRNPLILPAISLDMFAVLFGGATALLPIYAVEILHTDARGLGWLRAAPSIGAAAMALLTAHRIRFVNAGRALLWAVAGFGAATVVFGLSRNPALSFFMLLLTGAFDNISVVLRHSLVQTETPDAVRGRVLAVNNIFISCSNQLGAVESGWVAALLGAVPSVVLGGVATMAIAGLWAAWSKSLRQWQSS